MKINRIIMVLTVAAAVLLSACQAQKPSFVRVEDGKFVCEDYPSHCSNIIVWHYSRAGTVAEQRDIWRFVQTPLIEMWVMSRCR